MLSFYRRYRYVLAISGVVLVLLLPLQARISGVQLSPDRRFRVDSLGDDSSLALFDKQGNRLLTFDDADSSRGANIFWSPDSQHLVIVTQWKWDVVLFAAAMTGEAWQTVQLPEYDKDIEGKAEPLLHRTPNRKWELQEDYLDGLEWLSASTFELKIYAGFGNGNNVKDPVEEREAFDCIMTVQFTANHTDVSNVRLSPHIEPSDAPSLVNPPDSIESDPRYAPQDARLNQVYSALRVRLSAAKREKLKLMERDFLNRRESLRSDPDRFFSMTDEQIALLLQMLNAANKYR